jgi:hypothetical protein
MWKKNRSKKPIRLNLIMLRKKPNNQILYMWRRSHRNRVLESSQTRRGEVIAIERALIHLERDRTLSEKVLKALEKVLKALEKALKTLEKVQITSGKPYKLINLIDKYHQRKSLC